MIVVPPWPSLNLLARFDWKERAENAYCLLGLLAPPLMPAHAKEGEKEVNTQFIFGFTAGADIDTMQPRQERQMLAGGAKLCLAKLLDVDVGDRVSLSLLEWVRLSEL